MLGLILGTFTGILNLVGDVVNNSESAKDRQIAQDKQQETYIDHYGATRLVSNNHHAFVQKDKNGDNILYDCGTNGTKMTPIKNYSQEQRAIQSNKWIEKQKAEGKRFINPIQEKDVYAYKKPAPIYWDTKYNNKRCKIKEYKSFTFAMDPNTKKFYDCDMSSVEEYYQREIKRLNKLGDTSGNCAAIAMQYIHYVKSCIEPNIIYKENIMNSMDPDYSYKQWIED